jgi:hypothetical protein
MKPMASFIDPKEKWQRRFAWLPKRSSKSNRWIWLRHYWQVEIYMDGWGKVPIKGLKWSRILTENEVLVQQIKNPK